MVNTTELLRWLEKNALDFNDSACGCCSNISLAQALAEVFPETFVRADSYPNPATFTMKGD